jgi:hypothetical protein
MAIGAIWVAGFVGNRSITARSNPATSCGNAIPARQRAG